MTQQLGEHDLGTYAYVAEVYNENMRLAPYKLPTSAADGTNTLIDDAKIKMTMAIADQRVTKVTIQTPQPQSTEYMQVFEGFEFGLEALGGWINTYNRSTSTHGKASDVVNGILASYDTTAENVLTVSLTRA